MTFLCFEVVKLSLEAKEKKNYKTPKTRRSPPESKKSRKAQEPPKKKTNRDSHSMKQKKKWWQNKKQNGEGVFLLYIYRNKLSGSNQAKKNTKKKIKKKRQRFNSLLTDSPQIETRLQIYR